MTRRAAVLVLQLERGLQRRVDGLVAGMRAAAAAVAVAAAAAAAAHGGGLRGKILGVHVRGTDHGMEMKSGNVFSLPHLMESVAAVAEAMAAASGGAAPVIFLAADSHDAVAQFKARFGADRLFAAAGVPRSAHHDDLNDAARFPMLGGGPHEQVAARTRAQGSGLVVDAAVLARCDEVLYAPPTNVVSLALLLATAAGLPRPKLRVMPGGGGSSSSRSGGGSGGAPTNTAPAEVVRHRRDGLQKAVAEQITRDQTRIYERVATFIGGCARMHGFDVTRIAMENAAMGVLEDSDINCFLAYRHLSMCSSAMATAKLLTKEAR